MNSYISAQLRREVIDRAGNCCEYCRISQEDQFFAFEIDHIIAEKHGGPTVGDNLCLSCPECNAFKGSDIASIDWDNDEQLTGLFIRANKGGVIISISMSPLVELNHSRQKTE